MICTHCNGRISNRSYKNLGFAIYCSRACAVQAGVEPAPERKKVVRAYRVGHNYGKRSPSLKEGGRNFTNYVGTRTIR